MFWGDESETNSPISPAKKDVGFCAVETSVFFFCDPLCSNLLHQGV